MSLQVLRRWWDVVRTRRHPSAEFAAATPIRIETYPPLEWRSRRRWPSRFGSWLTVSASPASTSEPPVRPSPRRARSDALAATRLEFADALIDIRTRAAVETLDRIALSRSLHELWHFRAEVFSLVATCRDQAEAARRLTSLDRHFPKRVHRPGFSVFDSTPSAHA